MSGRTKSVQGRRVGRALGSLVAAAGVLTASLLITDPAGAATTVKSQLSLSGLASADNPVGGSQLGIHPGDSVSFTAAGAPTRGLDKVGLGDLADNITGLLTKFQVTADFSKLGGSSKTVLSGSKAATFRLSKIGTYQFTWTFQSVNLLGGIAAIPAIDFSGNQAKKLGVTVNADNEYVGQVVVATNPPKGGISIQLPKVSVQPKVGGVSLPKVTIPGVNLPTVRVPVPDLNPTKGSGTKKSQPSGGSSASSGSASSTTNEQLPVPARVFGAGLSGGGSSSGGGSGGYYASNVGGISPLGNGQSLTLGSSNGNNGSASSDSLSGNGSKSNADQLAASDPPSAQLPVVLAIIAIIALSLVASTYARLFLLRRT